MDKLIKKWDWKTWALIALGGTAVIASAAFMMQSKHAALGRQVHRNVTKFLVHHGSQVHSGVISGGLVSTPMKVNIAVNSTVNSMLNNYAEMLEPQNMPGGAPAMSETESVSTSPRATRDGPPSPMPQQQQPSSAASPSPSPRSGSPRTASGAVVRNPSAVATDDGGYGQSGGRTGGGAPPGEYNPLEFMPQGSKPPQNFDVFSDDRPGPASAAMPPAPSGGGYE